MSKTFPKAMPVNIFLLQVLSDWYNDRIAMEDLNGKLNPLGYKLVSVYNGENAAIDYIVDDFGRSILLE